MLSGGHLKLRPIALKRETLAASEAGFHCAIDRVSGGVQKSGEVFITSSY